MLMLIALLGGFVFFVGSVMLIFFSVTGEPPTPRRMIVRMTARVRRYTQTIGYGRKPRDGENRTPDER